MRDYLVQQLSSFETFSNHEGHFLEINPNVEAWKSVEMKYDIYIYKAACPDVCMMSPTFLIEGDKQGFSNFAWAPK